MKTLNKDQFAKFVAEELLTIKSYSFDVFYDIIQFNNIIKETEIDKVERVYFWYLRECGTWLIDANNTDTIEQIKVAFEHSKIYQLTFHKEKFNENFSVVKVQTVK